MGDYKEGEHTKALVTWYYIYRHHTHPQKGGEIAKGPQAEKYGGRGNSEFKLIKDHNNLLCITEQHR